MGSLQENFDANFTIGLALGFVKQCFWFYAKPKLSRCNKFLRAFLSTCNKIIRTLLSTGQTKRIYNLIACTALLVDLSIGINQIAVQCQ